MKNYLKASLFGLIFGFLLQKGGVTKYHILEGQLMLVDFTVMKVMLSAIIVGALGFHILRFLGRVKAHVKPTQLLANVSGGVIFGVGFAFAGYCPGTGAAALGQGDFHALYYMGGMLLGSFVYAEFSRWLNRRVKPIGDLGEKTLSDVARSL